MIYPVAARWQRCSAIDVSTFNNVLGIDPSTAKSVHILLSTHYVGYQFQKWVTQFFSTSKGNWTNLQFKNIRKRSLIPLQTMLRVSSFFVCKNLSNLQVFNSPLSTSIPLHLAVRDFPSLNIPSLIFPLLLLPSIFPSLIYRWRHSPELLSDPLLIYLLNHIINFLSSLFCPTHPSFCPFNSNLLHNYSSKFVKYFPTFVLGGPGFRPVHHHSPYRTFSTSFHDGVGNTPCCWQSAYHLTHDSSSLPTWLVPVLSYPLRC